MKKIYVAFVLVNLVNGLAAQPVLTDENFNPLPGESGTEYDFDATDFDPGPSGPGMTWNYPVLALATPHTLNVFPAHATPYGLEFSGANIAVTGNMLYYNYYLAHDNGLEYLGYTNNVFTMPLSNPALIYTYPFTFLSVISDSLEGYVTTGDEWTHRWGQVVTEADGYGTLVTPLGSYMDVLRIKQVWTYDDEVYDGSTTTVYHHTDTHYYWVTEGVHFPLLTYAEKKTVGGATTELSYSATYMDPASITTGLGDEEAFTKGFIMYPNPARSVFVSLWVNHNKNEEVNVIVWDATGKQKTSGTCQLTEGNNQLLLDISTLNAGIYFVGISNLSGKTVRKLVIE